MLQEAPYGLLHQLALGGSKRRGRNFEVPGHGRRDLERGGAALRLIEPRLDAAVRLPAEVRRHHVQLPVEPPVVRLAQKLGEDGVYKPEAGGLGNMLQRHVLRVDFTRPGVVDNFGSQLRRRYIFTPGVTYQPAGLRQEAVHRLLSGLLGNAPKQLTPDHHHHHGPLEEVRHAARLVPIHAQGRRQDGQGGALVGLEEFKRLLHPRRHLPRDAARHGPGRRTQYKTVPHGGTVIKPRTPPPHEVTKNFTKQPRDTGTNQEVRNLQGSHDQGPDRRGVAPVPRMRRPPSPQNSLNRRTMRNLRQRIRVDPLALFRN